MQKLFVVCVLFVLSGCDIIYSERAGFAHGYRDGWGATVAYGICQTFPNPRKTIIPIERPVSYASAYREGYAAGCRAGLRHEQDSESATLRNSSRMQRTSVLHLIKFTN